MLVRYAILSAMGDQARSTAEIYRAIAPLFQSIRPLSLAQIRNTLHRLEPENLVGVHAYQRHHRLWRRSPRGTRALDQWLWLPPARPPSLSPRLARLRYALAEADAPALEAICRRDCADLERRQRLLENRTRSENRDPRRMWILQLAIREIEIEKIWIQEFLDTGGKVP